MTLPPSTALIPPGQLLKIPPSIRLNSITPKQREILVGLASSYSMKELSFRLKVSRKTLEGRRAAMQNKLGTSDIVAITRFAVREKLVSVDP